MWINNNMVEEKEKFWICLAREQAAYAESLAEAVSIKLIFIWSFCDSISVFKIGPYII